MILQSGRKNKSDTDDVISSRPFVVLADIFILLFVLFLVMPFFMYFHAERVVEFEAMKQLRDHIQKPPSVDNIPYDQIATTLLREALKRESNVRINQNIRKNEIPSKSLSENKLLVEKFRSGDLIRFRLQGTELGENPLSYDKYSKQVQMSLDAERKVIELAQLVRPFASGNGLMVTERYKTLEGFLNFYQIDLNTYLGGWSLNKKQKSILWNDHIRQADRRGVIKRITLQGHRDKDEEPEVAYKRATKVADVFQGAGGKPYEPFEPDEVEVAVVSRPLMEYGDELNPIVYPNQYVDIILVFNQDYAVLFKDKLENMNR
jgi:hypothetical protein